MSGNPLPLLSGEEWVNWYVPVYTLLGKTGGSGCGLYISMVNVVKYRINRDNGIVK